MKLELERRLAELSQEISRYPGPIARCDLHLPALLEERSKTLEKLERLSQESACSPAAVWTNDGGFNAA